MGHGRYITKHLGVYNEKIRLIRRSLWEYITSDSGSYCIVMNEVLSMAKKESREDQRKRIAMEIKARRSDSSQGDFNFSAKDNNITTSDLFSDEKQEGIAQIDIDVLIDAPDDWNFYSKLDDDSMVELVESILNNGLLSPIIVWEQTNHTYMILAGHNRVEAYRLIYSNLKLDEYKTIPTIVKNVNEIDVNQAKQIIIDTNWVQRKLSTLEKARSIVEKYKLLEDSNKTLDNGVRVRDVVAKDFGISGRQVHDYYMINNLISDIKDLVEQGKVGIKQAAKISRLDEETQYWLLENYRDKFSNKILYMIKADDSKENISQYFSQANSVKKQRVELTVHNLESIADFKKQLRLWIEEQHFDVTVK